MSLPEAGYVDRALWMPAPHRDARWVAETILVLLAGVAAGGLNAVGGGGTFLALPALVAVGLPPVTANASTTVALVPGAVASAWVYRRELVPVGSTDVDQLGPLQVAH